MDEEKSELKRYTRELWQRTAVWAFMYAGIAAMFLQWGWPYLGPRLMTPAPEPTLSGKVVILILSLLKAYRNALDFTCAKIAEDKRVSAKANAERFATRFTDTWRQGDKP